MAGPSPIALHRRPGRPTAARRAPSPRAPSQLQDGSFGGTMAPAVRGLVASTEISGSPAGGVVVASEAGGVVVSAAWSGGAAGADSDSPGPPPEAAGAASSGGPRRAWPENTLMT